MLTQYRILEVFGSSFNFSHTNQNFQLLNYFLSYCNIVKLSSANRQILSLYYIIHSNSEYQSLKSQLNDKIEFREQIKIDFIECLKSIRKSDRKIGNIILLFFENLIQLNYNIDYKMTAKTWEACHIKELENINLYYSIIYSNNYPKPYLDSILKHKSKIEDLVTEEI